jgi:AraC-like DNA-binding protein
MRYPVVMSDSDATSIAMPVSLPGLRVYRTTSTSLRTGVKDHYAIARIEQGALEWWGRGRTWRSTPGAILVKEPGDVHRDVSHDGRTVFTAVLLPAGDVATLRESGRVLTLPHLEPGDVRAASFQRLHDAVCTGADRLTLEVALVEAMGSLQHVTGAVSHHTRPVRRATQYIRERLSETFTLDELAVYSALDKFHLCRAFRAQVGMPPHKYLTHLRVQRARHLLRQGMRASDLAPHVGFYDQSQLTRHFKRIVGVTPARYAAKRGAEPSEERP